MVAQSVAFSPYLPQQHNYNDWLPSQAYYAFAHHAGCAAEWAFGNSSHTIFECLVSKDTDTLQAASNAVSSSGLYGTWAFLPVTDGNVVKSRPSEAILSSKLNGMKHLTSNVAEESVIFVPQGITSSGRLLDWILRIFPFFGDGEIASLLTKYPHDPTTQNLRFATSGTSEITALDTSATASGYQQLANLIYAESTFICPSYWLAQAYNNDNDKKGYKMQFSVPIALHGHDGVALFGNTRLPNHSDELVHTMQTILGRFVTTGYPGWEEYKEPRYTMMGVNQSGGQEVLAESPLDSAIAGSGAKWYVGPDLEVEMKEVDGKKWEGGRGKRCEFWRGVGGKVPM